MEQMGIQRDLQMSYEEALEKVPEALKTEGFGVLTEIDVKTTLKKKLDLDFRKYKILGACNPTLAHKALSSMLEVGVLLPCNVVVYENDAGNATVIAVDPMQAMAGADEPEIGEVAQTVRERLTRVLERI